MKPRSVFALFVLLVSCFVLATPGDAAAADEANYIVTLVKAANVGEAVSDAKVDGGVVLDTFNTVKGLLVKATAAEADKLAANEDVKFVERDGVVTLSATQSNPPSWGLDRIDQRNRPLNQSYVYNQTGAGVFAYIIDTGIHAAHNDFSGRVVAGPNTVDASPSTTDCNGHGTHTAGTTGGETFGVAKDVTLVAVRVFGCGNSTATSDIIEGVDWVTNNHPAGQPAVANMSLGGAASAALDNAVQAMINDGVATAVAAGNETANACNNSPARLPAAITTGATDINDNIASYSNFGTCVDLMAPGSAIVSAAPSGGSASLSGTSMAAPHVAGAAALILQTSPGASPSAVRDQIVNNASNGVVVGIKTSCSFLDNLLGSCNAGTPNKLLFTGTGGAPPPPPPPPPPPCDFLAQLLGQC